MWDLEAFVAPEISLAVQMIMCILLGMATPGCQ